MATKGPTNLELLDALNPSEEAFHSKWIIHISSEMFAVWQHHFLPKIDISNAAKIRKLSADFAVLELNQPTSARQLFSTVFPRWASPLQHQWPVDPNSKGFVEKATQGILKKFGSHWSSSSFFYITETQNYSHGSKRAIDAVKNRAFNSIEHSFQISWRHFISRHRRQRTFCWTQFIPAAFRFLPRWWIRLFVEQNRHRQHIEPQQSWR